MARQIALQVSAFSASAARRAHRTQGKFRSPHLGASGLLHVCYEAKSLVPKSALLAGTDGGMEAEVLGRDLLEPSSGGYEVLKQLLKCLPRSSAGKLCRNISLIMLTASCQRLALPQASINIT